MGQLFGKKRNKNCECSCGDVSGCCLSTRTCETGDTLKLTIQLTAYYPSDPPIGQSNCFSATFELEDITCIDGNWGTATRATYVKECSWCGYSYAIAFTVALTCGSDLDGEQRWHLVFSQTNANIGQTCNFYPTNNPDIIMSPISCDPILLSGQLSPCIDYDTGMCILYCINGDYSPHAPVCLNILIYETP